jgi:hypothetical protein
MKNHLLAITMLIALSSGAHAIPVPGHNTIEMKCISYFDYPVDPIKEPGVNPSAHIHTHYGIALDQHFKSKTIGDESQLHPLAPPVQNIPGGGVAPFKDPGYTPLPASCINYGDWAWYAIPTPLQNGVMGYGDRSWTWRETQTHPRIVSVMTLTWAAPVGVPVYEPPFGMASIVGDPHTMSEQAMSPYVYYTCGDLVNKTRKPRDCTGGAPTNPYPALVANYKAKVAAAAVQQMAVEMAIATGNPVAIATSLAGLHSAVDAVLVAVVALENAVAMPPPPVGATPSEWDHAGLVTAVIEFPDCWDGQAGYPNFDTQFGIGRNHFYYSTNGSCGNGVHIVKLFMSVVFRDLDTKQPMTNALNPDGSVKLSFASGPYYSFHADFGNVWNVGLGHLIAGCLNKTDLYGGFAPLNNWGPSCPIPRCPAPSPPEQTLAPSGVVVCRDQ